MPKDKPRAAAPANPAAPASHLHLAETAGPLAVGAAAVHCWRAARAVWLPPVLLGMGIPLRELDLLESLVAYTSYY
jgi:hypothetical protein